MSYRELVVELAREHAEALSDALLELGALSVSVEDADADTPDEQPLFGEPGLTHEPSRLHPGGEDPVSGGQAGRQGPGSKGCDEDRRGCP